MASTSTSKQWRDVGNKSYGVFLESEDNKRRKTYLEKAISSYYRAFETADDANDRSSAAKNYGTTAWRLAMVLVVLEEKPLQVEFRFREAIKYFSMATVDGQRCQSIDWVTALAESFDSCVTAGIDYIRTHSYRDQVVTLENYVSSMHEETQLAHCFLEMAVVLSNKGVVALADKDWLSALQSFHDCHRPVQECLRLSARGVADVYSEASVIENDVQFNMCTAEAMQAIKIGDDTLKSAVEDYESLNINMVYNAIDYFKKAVLAAKEIEVELEAVAVSRLGSVFDKFGKTLYIIEYKEKAKAYFKQCLLLATSLQPRNCTAEPWYKTSSEALQRYQNEAVFRDESLSQEERSAYIEELEKELDDIRVANDAGGGRSGTVHLLRHLYKEHPPKNELHTLSEEAVADALDTDLDTKGKRIMKLILTAITHYHPDKQDQEKFGRKWVVLCEEITKILNSRYDVFKL